MCYFSQFHRNGRKVELLTPTWMNRKTIMPGRRETTTEGGTQNNATYVRFKNPQHDSKYCSWAYVMLEGEKRA